MEASKLREEILGELDQLQKVVDELASLNADIEGRASTLREKVAAAGFLAQFYTGIENILKRISRYHDVPLPEGEGWHAELFNRFAEQQHEHERGLPILFDEHLTAELARYRGFRHVVRMAYGVELKWSLMREGVDRVADVYLRLERSLSDYMQHLEERP